MKGEVSPGRGFSSGALHAENGARRCFGGSFLKNYVNCFLPLKEWSPGTIITGIVDGHYRVIIIPGDDNGIIYIAMKQPLQSAEVFTE